MKDLLKVLIFGGIFLIPFLPIYVENDFFFPYITGKNFAFRIIVEIAFAAWVLLALMEKEYRPKFSWIFAAFGSFLGVMFFANLLGEHPLQSFWSNFERMDGYVTVVHVFMLAVIMGSVMKSEKLWTYFFYTSTFVAVSVALYGLAQMAGFVDGARGRLDSRLGNAAYMAIYMLFHIFILGWLAVRSKDWRFWLVGAVILAIYAYALLLTGTRGTILGFVGGAVVSVTYIALFGRKYPELRTYAKGGVIALVILILSFMAVKDSEYIQSNSTLARIANINIAADLETRSVIWNMALEGVKERPLLGWGQGNFNFVFNEKYEPVLYNKEAWYDRVHNIVLDWLVAGGVLGFLAYASIFVALLYYLLYLPLFKNDERLDVLERAVIIGLLAGYILHNLVVFDNIISYIFFAAIIALVHFKVADDIKAFADFEIEEKMVTQIVAPIMLVATLAIVYFVNVPGIRAAGDIIDAMRAPSLVDRLEEFHTALEHHSFADQEIVEQLAQQAMAVARRQDLPETERQMIVQRAELELMRMIEEKPGDARLHSFLSTFYRNIGALPQAREQALQARSLSPRKPAIIVEQGVVEIQEGKIEVGRDFFKEAYELETSNVDALVLYAATEAQLGNMDLVNELITDTAFETFTMNEYALSSVSQSGDLELLAEMFELRVTKSPENPQNWASLAYVYYQLNDRERSVDALTRAGENIPEFKEQASCYIENINAGNEPTVGCTQ